MARRWGETPRRQRLPAHEWEELRQARQEAVRRETFKEQRRRQEEQEQQYQRRQAAAARQRPPGSAALARTPRAQKGVGGGQAGAGEQTPGRGVGVGAHPTLPAVASPLLAMLVAPR